MRYKSNGQKDQIEGVIMTTQKKIREKIFLVFGVRHWTW